MTKKEKAEVEELYGTIARFARENTTLRISDRKHYERARRLENAIRLHSTKGCKCKSQRECLTALARLVTLKPRPVYKMRGRNRAE